MIGLSVRMPACPERQCSIRSIVVVSPLRPALCFAICYSADEPPANVRQVVTLSTVPVLI